MISIYGVSIVLYFLSPNECKFVKNDVFCPVDFRQNSQVSADRGWLTKKPSVHISLIFMRTAAFLSSFGSWCRFGEPSRAPCGVKVGETARLLRPLWLSTSRSEARSSSIKVVDFSDLSEIRNLSKLLQQLQKYVLTFYIQKPTK